MPYGVKSLSILIAYSFDIVTYLLLACGSGKSNTSYWKNLQQNRLIYIFSHQLGLQLVLVLRLKFVLGVVLDLILVLGLGVVLGLDFGLVLRLDLVFGLSLLLSLSLGLLVLDLISFITMMSIVNEWFDAKTTLQQEK